MRQAVAVSGTNADPGGERAEAGDVVGPYRLVEPLGRGGMGEVWRAEDPTGASGSAPRLVAVKLLDARMARDPAIRARFGREVAALRKVASQYVAPLLDADVDADVPWLASAYVAGPTLAEQVERYGPLADAPLRALGRALAEALTGIHAAGVVHRDLTPRNVVLGPDGPRVVDFGIAWFPGAVRVTQAGSSVGTPAWMAPELLPSGQATAASDVWSWGAVMAYAALGRPMTRPVTGPMSRAPAVPGGASIPHDIAELPGWLARWVRAATAADPGVRPTAAELRAVMTSTAAGETLEVTATRDLDVTREVGATAQAGRTRVFDVDGGPPSTPDAGSRLARWGSAAAVVAAAAAIGALTGPLTSVMVTAVLVVVALALHYKRAQRPDGARPLPPTWAVGLASVVVLGVGLVHAFGPVPGVVALVILVVAFVVLAGDIVT
jgi:eukaryotic-like serine/threonine-protein kinase